MKVHRNLGFLFLLGILALVATPALADGNNDGSLEVFVGEFYPDGDFGDGFETVGLRFGWWWGKWGLEVAGSQQDAASNVDFAFIDFSTLYTFYRTDLSNIFVLGGSSLFLADIDDSPDIEDFALHFGVGWKIHLGEHFYLRPDVRLRWINGSDFDDFGGEATVSAGFRF